jgi:desulfoferrodoxin (superoxide reductase-like protein)
MKKIRLTLTVLLLTILTLPVVTVHANVPNVLSITRRTDSGNTLIDVKVSHSDPSTTHYISQITLDLDGATKTFTDLPKATATDATYTLNIRAVTPKTIKAQATCNLHGPSAWFNEAGGTTSSGIDAYPMEAVLIGVALAVTVLNRKR